MNAIVAWFAKNPIAANILMALIIYGGFSTYPQLDREFFPQRGLNKISISMVYPGAGPEEIEQQIVNRIEEAISDVDGIDEFRSTASEGLATVTVDVQADVESLSVLNDIKTQVDSITNFPALAEPPEVKELLWKSRTVSVALYGDLSEAEIKALGNSLRDDLASKPGIPQVQLREPRKFEVSIEVTEHNLRRYGLSFDDVAQAVRNSSLNIPAGKLRTENGNIQIQTRAQGFVAADFERIALINNLDGAVLRLGDVANIIDGFEENDIISGINGKRSLSLDVYISTNPDVVKVSDTVKSWVEDVSPRLPDGVELYVWRDMSTPFKDRLGTLMSNGLGGLALVYCLLLLFLRPLLAMWVCVGIATAFLGAVALMPVPGITLNMVSLFAFIMILGILVDDAIIVGESVYSHQERGMLGQDGAIVGTQRMMKPVLFAVISTMIFFIPFFFLPEDQPEPRNMAWVVLLALTFSLIESLLILPAHLAQMKPENPKPHAIFAPLNWLRARCSKGMAKLSENYYQPLLKTCLAWSTATLLSFALFFMTIVAVVVGGWMKSSFFPIVPISSLMAEVTVYDGTPFATNETILKQLNSAAESLRRELAEDDSRPDAGHIESTTYNSSVRVSVELLDTEDYNTPIRELRDRWLELIGELPEVKEFDIRFTMFDLGKPIQLELASEDLSSLKAASLELKEALGRYPGVYNVRSSLETPVPELRLKLKPHAEALGISLNDVARQVRQGFYGEEVQRIPRKREDVKVMVRYAEDERTSLEDLRNMRIRTASGEEIPFDAIASYEYASSYSKIDHLDRKRTATVTADLQKGFSPRPIITQVIAANSARWKQQYPDLDVRKSGETEEEAEFVAQSIQLTIMSMIIIYGLFAIVFRSWGQPILVVSAIPFGFAGAMIGHMLFDQAITMFSILGVIAVAGVVVNDNLVMIDRINELRNKGLDFAAAITEGATDRFRPIILTSVTTFISLLPVMTETSTQAKFLLPMVLSLAFGILLATFVTLLFVPSLYYFGLSLKQRLIHNNEQHTKPSTHTA